MSLDGFYVINSSGLPIYTNSIEFDINQNPLLLSGYMSAIQTFAHEIIDNKRDSFIREMNLPNYKLMYREIKSLTFVGIAEQNGDVKIAEIILEYMIWAFLTLFRPLLKSSNIFEMTPFEKFDEIFLNFRNSKEKDLKKLLKTHTLNTNRLEGILNTLINYFPINELIKINSEMLKIIGKKLIYVNHFINPEEEERIIKELRKNTTLIYGPEIFNTIEKEYD